MLAITLPDDIEKRLSILAKKTHRTKTFYAREAILEHLEEMEDIYLSLECLERDEELLTTNEIKKQIELNEPNNKEK